MRAIAFTRVSTGRQDEGVRQIQQIRKYCAGVGYELLEDKTISEIVSGVADDREGLNLLTHLSKADADIIIVSETSRITRKNEDDFMDLLNIVKTIQKTGLDLHILGSSQTYTADRKLTLIDVITLVIEADRNSKERETILVRTKTGKDKKLAAGGYIGHILPFGYRVNRTADCYFEINEEEAATIKLMFDLVGNQSYSVNQTGKYLMRTQGCKWHTTSVSRMLKNPAYKGEFTIMEKLIKVPAIVTAELFEQVQVKMKENHLFISKGTKNFSPLKGILKCACGCNMFTYTSAKNGTSYKCSTKNTAALVVKSCGNGGIQTKTLNSLVWDVTRVFVKIDDFKAKSEEQKNIIKLEIKAIEKSSLVLLNEKNELSVKIESLTDTIISADKNIISILSKRLSKLVDESAEIEKEIEKLNFELTKLNNRMKDLSINLLPELVNNVSEEGKHEIYLKYIDSVTYYSVTKYKGFIVIQYKNGLEGVVMSSTRPKIVAYALPFNFLFNSANRLVFEDAQGINSMTRDMYKGYALPTATQLTFQEMEKKYFKTESFKKYLLNV